MEAIFHLLISIVVTAIIAGLIVWVGNGLMGYEFQFLITWLLCFLMWLGIFIMGEC